MTSGRARQFGPALALVAGLAALLAVAVIGQDSRRVPLTEVYTPSFARIPPLASPGATVETLISDLRTPAGLRFLEKLVPSQAGALWLSLLLLLMLAIDFERPASPSNVDLIAVQLLGVVMFEISAFFRVIRDPVYLRLLDWVFMAIVALSVGLIVHLLWRVLRGGTLPWRPGLPRRAIIAVALSLIVCDVIAALVREPDDAGFFINLGAQRLRERHRLPYGDPMLDGSPGAAYGPLLFAAHVPVQLALAPNRVNQESPDRPQLGAESQYFLPPLLATKIVTILFHLAGVWALFIIGRRLGGELQAWALVALYCGSPFVLGVGGDDSFIGGMTYVSHIAPAAATLLAFAALPRPALAGALLPIAAGVGFFPAFLAPAWLGYYWSDRDARLRFVVAMSITGALLAGGILLLSRAGEARGLIDTILFDTFGHHTDPNGYGMSPFGFWGQRPGIRGWLMQPIAGASGFLAPSFLVFLALVGAGFWLARGRTAPQLALVTAVVTIAATLLKVHPTGTYVAWYYPFVLIGVLQAGNRAAASGPGFRPPVEAVPAGTRAPRDGVFP